LRFKSAPSSCSPNPRNGAQNTRKPICN
jgi:hypothetical protein